jgi:hypothetical protein
MLMASIGAQRIIGIDCKNWRQKRLGSGGIASNFDGRYISVENGGNLLAPLDKCAYTI